jgi:hypothetical protein
MTLRVGNYPLFTASKHDVNRAATGVARVMVGVVAGTTIPTVTESIPGATFSGDPSCRLFIVALTPSAKAWVFGEKHSALSVIPGAHAS